MRSFLKNNKKRLKLIIGSLATIVILFTGYAFVDNDFKIIRGLDIYYSLFREVSLYYVDETDPDKLVKNSIEGMLENLDPYTVFIDESQLDDYDFMTTGKYGGIGAIVRKANNSIVVVEPYEGSPAQKAGLRAGDIVYQVNGKDINGTEMDDISELLKGDPQTKIELTIERYKVPKRFKLKIIREKIAISSVTYSGLLNASTGYIKISGFTEGTAADVKKAFLDLKNKGAKALVIDLRENPGGLLNEAVSVVSLFVDKGMEIVSTRGKFAQFNSVYRTSSQPVDTQIPLAVLVNRGSASASEIVAGSLQDLDRAVIIGQRTYGKGLVQSTRPLSYNTKLKITTAKYYIPSGRCIQALDYSHRNADGSVAHVPDSLIRAFKTAHGRTVYDGGGVFPDIYLASDAINKISIALYSGNYFFDFATQFAAENKAITSPDKFRISAQIYERFIQFLKEKKFDYTTDSENALKKLRSTVQSENYSDATKAELDALEQKLAHNKFKDLEKYKPEISDLLCQEIVSRYYYQTGRVKASLIDDKELEKALQTMEKQTLYTGILNGSIKAQMPAEEKRNDYEFE
jgi:carboxyl-terminal processing protease